MQFDANCCMLIHEVIYAVEYIEAVLIERKGEALNLDVMSSYPGTLKSNNRIILNIEHDIHLCFMRQEPLMI